MRLRGNRAVLTFVPVSVLKLDALLHDIFDGRC